MPGALASRDLLRGLVVVAASRLSVPQAWDQLDRAPSGPTVLGPRSSPCSALDAFAGHHNDLLARPLPKGWGQRGRRVAIDVVARPYHGTGEEAHQDEVQVPHLPYCTPWGQRHASPLVLRQRSSASLPPTRSILWDRGHFPCADISPGRAYRRGSGA